jgi:hypothetical protein
MLILRSNTMQTVNSMTNENPSFPKENAIDKQPQRVAKSSANSTVIVGSASSLTDVALLNVFADTANVKVIDHSKTDVFNGTDIAITSATQITSVSTDLAGIPPGSSIVIKGFSTAQNNGVFTTSGTSSTNLITVTGGLSAEIAGPNVEIVLVEDEIEYNVTFAECKSYTDYFTGVAYVTDRHFEQLDQDITGATIILTLAGTLPSIGIIFTGRSRSYGRTQYGAVDNIEDTSLYRKSVNGALNQVQRPVIFSASPQIEATNNEIYQLKKLFERFNSEFMIFVLLPDNETGLRARYIFYCKIEKKPRIIWNRPDSQGYQLEITAVGGYE